MKSPLLRSAALLAVGSAVLLQSFQANQETPSASYSRGVPRVSIPYFAPRAGAGRLGIEILDSEDHPAASSDRRIEISSGTGEWKDKFASALKTEELVWHRLHYRFVYSDLKNATIEGIDSISEILRRPTIHVLGQRSYLSGASAASA